MTEINKKLDLAMVPPTNNDGDPYILPLDIYKEGYSCYNISNWFKGRVGDNGTPFAIRWYSHGRLLNIQGMRPFIEGQVGDYTIDDSDPDNVRIDMAEDASNIHIVGDVDDTQAGGVAIYRLINQAFPKSGIFYGKIGFMGTQDDGTLVNTGVDIVFKVLAGHMNMLGARKFYVTELEKAWLEMQDKFKQYNQEYKDTTTKQAEQFKADTEKALADLQDKIKAELSHHEGAVLEDINALKKISASIADLQTQIDANNIVRKSDYNNDILKLRQEMQTELSGTSKSGPYFFENFDALKTSYPDGHEGILITQNDLHWHYWNAEQKQYIDAGAYKDSSSNLPSIIRIKNNMNSISGDLFGPVSRTYFNRKYYASETSLHLNLTSKYGIDFDFNQSGTLKSVCFEPYQKGKLYLGIATQIDDTHLYMKSEKIIDIADVNFQKVDVNLYYDANDILYISGPIKYAYSDNGYAFYEIGYATPENAVNSSIGYQNCFKNDNKIKLDLELELSEQVSNTTLFPSMFHGKRIKISNTDIFSDQATALLDQHTKYLLNYQFKDSGTLTKIYYNAPNDGYINLGIGNLYDYKNGNARIHDDISIKVSKGSGSADVKLPFFANDYLLISGQVGFAFRDNGYDFFEKKHDREFDATAPIFGDTKFDMHNDQKMLTNLKFDAEIDDSSHFNQNDFNTGIEPIKEQLKPIKDKKWACFGDSIWSDQVSGIGTIIQKDLNAQMIGNFATGWATCQDWFDSGNNITPVTFKMPQNTDTADNVLSNQIRRILQWTTEKDQIIKWHHLVDGWFNIDGDIGLGLGHTDDIPDVIGIAISTNDGKHQQCGNLDDDTDAVFQQHYKDLTRNSIASALRWAIETLQAAYPNSKIFIFTPLQTIGKSPWMSYQNNLKKTEIIKKVGAFCSVPVIDQLSESGLNSQTVVTGTADGVHPSGDMKDKIAAFDARQIEKKY